jgi:hypothetical protein
MYMQYYYRIAFYIVLFIIDIEYPSCGVQLIIMYISV